MSTGPSPASSPPPQDDGAPPIRMYESDRNKRDGRGATDHEMIEAMAVVVEMMDDTSAVAKGDAFPPLLFFLGTPLT